MSEIAPVDPASTSDNLLPRWQAPPIEKTPRRPAPTAAYSWREYNPQAKLLYIRSHEQANTELALLKPGPLGFDLEWKPIFYRGARENPVALVQLANDDTILLLQISAMEEFPSKLAEVLANPDIVKTGVAIQNDAKKLYNDCMVSIHNCVDLSLFARTVDNARWQGKYTHPIGLAHLVESYEYRLLEKGRITRSNWEALLDANQQQYASNDAHSGYILYKKLESMLPSLPSPPERDWYSFNLIAGQLVDQNGSHWRAYNPNYDPGPLPPPRLPREINASMITSDQSSPAAQDSSAGPSTDDTSRKRKSKSTFQERQERRDRSAQIDNPSPFALHVPSAGGSGSAYQRQTQGDGYLQRTSGPSPPHLPQRPRQHAPNTRTTGALATSQGASPAQPRPESTRSGFQSNIRGGFTAAPRQDSQRQVGQTGYIESRPQRNRRRGAPFPQKSQDAPQANT
ncbi:ribonuclease H-like domain-containing protein [Crassisporium funariophilum]|nr:ribonuclease H-like domain-containing protein [Crassisporium funariophilum]